VIEVSNKLHVSKVTIYKKMELLKKELKGHIIKKKNITFLDDYAIELIKNHLSVDVSDENLESDSFNLDYEVYTEFFRNIDLNLDKIIKRKRIELENINKKIELVLKIRGVQKENIKNLEKINQHTINTFREE
jgi:hypothetical protein